jgi:predicted secreted protein
MSTLDTSSNSKRREVKGTGRDEQPIYDKYYSARAEFHVKFADFDVLNTLATRFSAMTDVKIQRIEWKLTDATLASIQGATRKRAAEDAIQKARDYAEAFANVQEADFPKKVRAFEVREDGYDSYRQSTRPQLHYGKGQRLSRRDLESEELQFQPEDVRLEVKVHTKFSVDL